MKLHDIFTSWHLLPSALLLTVVMAACINDDFSTSQSDVLSFSTDTVTFDTVITLQTTATRQFVVYNRGSKQIRISDIHVEGTATGGHFNINVDGLRGSSFSDIEVRGGDSIYVFVEGYLDEAGQNAPQRINDRVVFTTNGVTQTVALRAWGQDVVRLSGDTIRRNTRFTADKPYLIYDTLFVAPDVVLHIDAGATLLFHDKGAMRVAGTLRALGTVDKPIVMRGDRLDHVVGDIDFDIMSGQWGGLIFPPTSKQNVMHYVDMHSSSIGIHVSTSNPAQRSLYLLNCVLHNSSSSLLTTGGAWVEAVGTEFSEAGSSLVNFIGGKILLSSCTLANYYLFAAPTEPMVSFFVKDDSGIVTNLDASLNNCILYGASTELNMPKLDDTNIYIRNCLFRSPGDDDSHFIGCVWAGDPKYFMVRDEYIFDYRLHHDSDARARGDISLLPASARTDRYGTDRLARGDGLDLGAYAITDTGTE